MKNSIVLGLNFEYSLMEYYKKLSLSENEVMVLFAIKHLLEQKNGLITADLLSLKMNLSNDEIDDILVDLLSKKFIEYRKSHTYKGLVTTLRPLEEKLMQLYSLDVSALSEYNRKEKAGKSSKNIYDTFEKQLGRTLSPAELSLIDDWLSDEISEEIIISSLNEAIKKKKTSLKAVDKIILTNLAREDIDNEGHTAISTNWKKNINKTIDIVSKQSNFNNDKK